MQQVFISTLCINIFSLQLPSTLPPSLQHQQLSCESRPFLMLSNSDKLSQSAYFPQPTTMQQQQQLQHQKQHQMQQQLVYSDAQPLSSIGSQWSSTVYPFTSFGQQKLIPSFKSSKSLQQVSILNNNVYCQRQFQKLDCFATDNNTLCSFERSSLQATFMHVLFT
jgi:hypothetical protein